MNNYFYDNGNRENNENCMQLKSKMYGCSIVMSLWKLKKLTVYIENITEYKKQKKQWS